MTFTTVLPAINSCTLLSASAIFSNSSFVMGERVSVDEWLTYIPIWCAVLLLVVEGILHLIKEMRKKKYLEKNIEKLNEDLTGK